MKAYVVMYRRADLIGGQLNLIQKFVPDVTEVRVVNNGPDYRGLENECRRLNLTSISCLQPVGAINTESHANALNLLWQTWGAWDDDDALILDHDIFPFRPASPMSWLQDHHIAARIYEGPPSHPWAGLMAIRRDCPRRESIRFNPHHGRGAFCNPGGLIGEYITRHGLKVKNLSCRPADGSMREVFDEAWLHHRDASDWGGRGRVMEDGRTKKLYAFIAQAMRDENPKP